MIEGGGEFLCQNDIGNHQREQFASSLLSKST